MKRTQLYLEDSQYRWLKDKAGSRGSIAGIVRGLIDAARARGRPGADDPLISYLLSDPPAPASKRSSVRTLDQDVYG